MVVPVIRNGEVRFVLSANLRSRSFSDILMGPALPDGWVGQCWTATGLSWRAPGVGGLRRQTGDRVSAQRNRPGSQQLFLPRSIEGQEVYTAFTTSPLSGWTVAVGAPGEVVASSQRRSLLAVAAGGLIALGVTLGLATLLIGGTLRRQAMEQRLMTLSGSYRRAPVERRRGQSARCHLPPGGGCRRNGALPVCQCRTGRPGPEFCCDMCRGGW